IEAVLGDDLHTRCDQIAQPVDDLLAVEVLTVGVAQRDVDRVNNAVGAPRNANACDVPAMPRPSGAALGMQPLVLGLGIESDNADAAQVGKLAWRLPIGTHDNSDRL